MMHEERIKAITEEYKYLKDKCAVWGVNLLSALVVAEAIREGFHELAVAVARKAGE